MDRGLGTREIGIGRHQRLPGPRPPQAAAAARRQQAGGAGGEQGGPGEPGGQQGRRRCRLDRVHQAHDDITRRRHRIGSTDRRGERGVEAIAIRADPVRRKRPRRSRAADGGGRFGGRRRGRVVGTRHRHGGRRGGRLVDPRIEGDRRDGRRRGRGYRRRQADGGKAEPFAGVDQAGVARRDVVDRHDLHEVVGDLGR